MTSRERLLAALKRQPVDRIPWSPFLAYWWEHQPEEMQQRGQLWFYRSIGADALLRGFTAPFRCGDVFGRKHYPSFDLPIPGVTIRTETAGNQTKICLETRYGPLCTTLTYSEDANSWFITGFPIKRREDYKIFGHIVENMPFVENYAAIWDEINQLGEDGLTFPQISPFLCSPFQTLLDNFVGPQQLYLDMEDYLDEVETLFAIMSEKALVAVRIAAEAPAEAYISWETSSTQYISPKYFERYILPEVNRWGEILHAAGKMLIHHACGHIRAILPQLATENADAMESVTPPPTGNVEIWDVQKALGKDKCIIGGIEPLKFLELSQVEFRAYVENTLAQMDPLGFIFGNSDSCPPGVSLEKFKLVTEIVRSFEVSPGMGIDDGRH
jgi:uroporphyrinogen-III decarboxylase